MKPDQQAKILVRFEQNYIVHPLSDCWLWIGSRTNSGYGRFWDGEKHVSSHRWSYEHFVGSISKDLHVDHLCRIRHCVNPNHLEPVTPRENAIRGAKVNNRPIDYKLVTGCSIRHTNRSKMSHQLFAGIIESKATPQPQAHQSDPHCLICLCAARKNRAFHLLKIIHIRTK